jgi:threonine-phosphate decarboxylase
MLFGHGDDGYRHNREIVADFSTNVWHGGAPAGLKDYIFSHWDKIEKYPEVMGESLIGKISRHHRFEGANILVTSGTTESIYLIGQALKVKRSTIVVPAFAEYEDACRLHGHDLSFLEWRHLSPDMRLDTDLLFICNPNNPTGEVFHGIEKLLVLNPGTIFVLDEAFIEFTVDITSVIQLVNKYDNLIVMRSMTKAYAIPGLRLGYIAAAPELIGRFKAVKLPWTVNTVALQAGHFIFDNYAALALPIVDLLRDKEDFIKGLANTPLKVFPGHTHFFVAETLYQDPALLKQFLLSEFDILIRDAGNFRGLGKGFIRLATLSKEKNQLLINALSEWKAI